MFNDLRRAKQKYGLKNVLFKMSSAELNLITSGTGATVTSSPCDSWVTNSFMCCDGTCVCNP